ncbi:hypothetical protein BUALT_Bualt08G0053700 [Buddleja alternifolia]|uniref:Uncharacterized protein n=1 Tax=Buddleja alternifolia TaxID=168488 RepID=A0AAV6XAH8_9LAMI|nr:hypothetical protein BUALT_Bualt08G0053700 [Buddleja alternifolia]
MGTKAKILSHSGISGFVSHCGWTSLKESIDFGVPIIAMPMHLDQPMNAKLMVELGVGVEFKEKFGEQREKTRLKCGEETKGVVEKLKEVCGKSIGTRNCIIDGRIGEEST